MSCSAGNGADRSPPGEPIRAGRRGPQKSRVAPPGDSVSGPGWIGPLRHCGAIWYLQFEGPLASLRYSAFPCHLVRDRPWLILPLATDFAHQNMRPKTSNRDGIRRCTSPVVATMPAPTPWWPRYSRSLAAKIFRTSGGRKPTADAVHVCAGCRPRPFWRPAGAADAILFGLANIAHLPLRLSLLCWPCRKICSLSGCPHKFYAAPASLTPGISFHTACLVCSRPADRGLIF